MPEVLVKKMKAIPGWIRALIFVLIVALVGTSAHGIAANYVAPFTAKVSLTLDKTFVPNADKLSNIAGEYQAQRVTATKSDAVLAMLNTICADIADETERQEAVAMYQGFLRISTEEGMTIAVTAQAPTREQAKELCDLFAAEVNKAIMARQLAAVSAEDGAQPANVMTEAVNVASSGGRVTIATLLAVVITAVLAYLILSAQPLFDSFNMIFFLLFTLICVFPFYYLFINTISNNDAVVSGQVNFLPDWSHVPKAIADAELASGADLGLWDKISLSFRTVLHNYIGVFKVSDIPQAFLVTTARTVIGTVLMVLVSAWAGYLVTKKKMWKRSLMYRLLVITMYFNAGLIPWYMNMFMLGLTDTFLAYILPGLVAPYNIILVKTYIESIPASLEESAVIDGANTPTVFLRIILPLSVPILATIAIFGAVGNWNSFQDSLLLMTPGRGMETLQHRLYIHLNQTSNLGAQASSSGGLSQQAAQSMLSSQVLKYTISMVTVIPILLVYPFMQRFFVKGIMLGAVKG